MSTAPIDTPQPASSLADHDALPMGTRFGEFEILSVLGVGGFGIVYLAHDHSLDRRVALKEYMPGALASRGEGALITVRSKSQQETYAIGLRSFVNEARLLARFDHPSLVKVYRFWEDNATAYMVMPYLQGVTLRDTRRAMSQAPDEAWIRSVVGPILGALDQLHREGVYHRDIAPDNVLLLNDGPPVLLDFGAARRVISDRTQSLTAILKPNYAPIEQYAEMTQMRQGPWTDLYALGAVIHFLLMGVPPVPATARAIQDDSEPIEHRRVAGVSPRFMAVVAWMLALRPNQRPQSVAALREVLDGHGPVPFVGATSAPQATLRAASPIGDSTTTLAITPHVPTQVVTAPQVSPSVAHSSTTAFQTIAQAQSPAAEPPTSQTYAPSMPMPTARPMPTGTAGAAIPQGPPANRMREARPATLPPTLARAAGGAAGAGSTVIRHSRTGLWIFSSAAAVFVAILVGWTVMRGIGIRAADITAPDAAASAAAAAASASAAADALAKARTTPPDPAPSIDGPATVQTVGDALVTGVPTLPPGRSPTSASTGSSTTSDATAPWPAVVNPTTAEPSRIARPTTTAEERTPQPPMAANARPSPISPPPSTRTATAATDRNMPIADRAPTTSRPVLNSVNESGLNAGSSLGTAASRARPQGSPVPPGTRPTAQAQAQLLDQSLTGRPVPATTTPVNTLPLQSTAATEPATAREACGRRVFIALAVCMDERCEEPRYRNSQECVKILETKRARENR